MSQSASDFQLGTAQPRSEATAARLVAVATELFIDGTLESTSVADIAKAAGVSVGGFYGRFKTKDDLRRAVAEAMLARLVAPFDELFSPEAIAALDAAGIVRRFAESLVRALGGEDDRDAFRRVVLLVRSDADLPESRAVRSHNAQFQLALAEALLSRREQIGHPDPESAVAFLDLAMSSAAREVLLHAGMGLHAGDKSQLIDQLTDLGCSFLRIPPTESES